MRDELWRYLSESATPAGVTPVVASVAGLSLGQLDRLLTTQLAMSGAAGQMLSAAATLIRRLPAQVSTERRVMHGEVEGEVDWERTRQVRLDQGDDRTLFACSPIVRKYDHPRARALVAALEYQASLSARSGLTKGGLFAALYERSTHAHHLRRHVKIRDVPAARRVGEARLERLENNNAWSPVGRYLRLAEHGLESRDPAVVLAVLEGMLLRPEQADKLFEMWVGFRMVRALMAAGYQLDTLQAVIPDPAPFATMRGPLGRIDLWRQRSFSVLAKGSTSRYAVARTNNALTSASLLPDWTLHFPDRDRFVPCEVKLYENPRAAVRQGLIELMAYIHDRPSLFTAPDDACGLLVAWDAPSVPASVPPLVVCSQATLPAGVARVLKLVGP